MRLSPARPRPPRSGWHVAGGVPDVGGTVERTGTDRLVRNSLRVGAVLLVLYPVIRYLVLPLFPPMEELLAVAVAAGAAGVIAVWLVRLGGRR